MQMLAHAVSQDGHVLMLKWHQICDIEKRTKHNSSIKPCLKPKLLPLQ